MKCNIWPVYAWAKSFVERSIQKLKFENAKMNLFNPKPRCTSYCCHYCIHLLSKSQFLKMLKKEIFSLRSKPILILSPHLLLLLVFESSYRFLDLFSFEMSVFVSLLKCIFNWFHVFVGLWYCFCRLHIKISLPSVFKTKWFLFPSFSKLTKLFCFVPNDSKL